MPHMMSPTATAALLLIALIIDYMSVGANSIRDRLAFLMATAAFREGFDGSPADAATVGFASDGIGMLLRNPITSGSYLAGASAAVLVGVLVVVAFLYALSCLAPNKWQKQLGRMATANFPASGLHKINWKLWGLAAILGMTADLPQGMAGVIIEACVVFLTGLFGPFIFWLLGVA
jgi:hypothetical protein